jgi:hypothetical protein
MITKILKERIASGTGIGTGPWELLFSRFAPITDPGDFSPVPTGLFYDRNYEHAFGCFSGGISVPITNPVLRGVMNLTGFAAIEFYPDGNVTQVLFYNPFRYTHLDAFADLLSLDFGVAQDASSTIRMLATGEFATMYADSGVFDTYFVIARRRVAG